ncbi:MAG: hypothetical protein ACTS80_02105 [Candidatus Hodgkinia cicadicola]
MEDWERYANGPLDARVARTNESVVSFEGGETARFQFNGSYFRWAWSEGHDEWWCGYVLLIQRTNVLDAVDSSFRWRQSNGVPSTIEAEASFEGALSLDWHPTG